MVKKGVKKTHGTKSARGGSASGRRKTASSVVGTWIHVEEEIIIAGGGLIVIVMIAVFLF